MESLKRLPDNLKDRPAAIQQARRGGRRAARADVLRELGVPEDYAVMIGIALGYEDPTDVNNQVRSIRRPVEDAVVMKGL